jgi:hypothetical protein
LRNCIKHARRIRTQSGIRKDPSLRFFERGTGSKGAEMKNKVFPLSMALLWSIVYTNALGSTALGICLGLLMGMVFGLFESGDDTGDQ